MIKISPSLLAADFLRLGDEVNSIRDAGADMLHLDIMDGVFVTNISFGFPVVEAIRKSTDMFLDVHLMIDRPERYIERFIAAGGDLVTFHLEATDCAEKCIKMIKDRGRLAAVSIKPNTPVEEVYPYIDKCDMVLIMTVEPGYGGQALIPECLEKVRKLRAEATARGIDIDIQVDGGINEINAPLAVACGANVLVAGSSVFKNPDRRAAIDSLR